jgi:hypothetical protein
MVGLIGVGAGVEAAGCLESLVIIRVKRRMVILAIFWAIDG